MEIKITFMDAAGAYEESVVTYCEIIPATGEVLTGMLHEFCGTYCSDVQARVEAKTTHEFANMFVIETNQWLVTQTTYEPVGGVLRPVIKAVPRQELARPVITTATKQSRG